MLRWKKWDHMYVNEGNLAYSCLISHYSWKENGLSATHQPGSSLAPKWIGNMAESGVTAGNQVLLEDVSTHQTLALPRQGVRTEGRCILRAANSFS